MKNTKEYAEKIYITQQCREQMPVILERPITIIQAPMGYGKTVAVREYLKSANVKTIWIDLKKCASNKRWEYFCKLVCDNFPEQQELCNDLLNCGLPTDEQMIYNIISIIDQFQPDYPLVYVVDNFQAVTNPYIFSLMEIAAESGYFNTHVVLLTRNAHSGKFDELMLKGKLALLDQNILCFNEDDIRNYFQLYGINLTGDAVRQLYSLTEGWISALYLILLKYEDESSIMIPSRIYEIIDFGWFSQLSEKEKTFLYYISVLDNFSFEQAQFICAGEESDFNNITYEILSGLTKENAFIYYDIKEKQYYIHRIIRKFLIKRINRLSEEKRLEIYRSWGIWFNKQNEYGTSMKYYIKCRDYSVILKSILDIEKHKISISDWPIYRTFIETCPEEIMSGCPEAVAVLSLFSYIVGEFELYQALRGILEACMENLEESAIEQMEANLKVIQALEAYNNADHILNIFSSVRESNLCVKAFFQAIGRNWTLGSFSPVLMFWNDSGGLQRNIEQVKKMIHGFQNYIPGCGAGGGQIMAAEARLLKGDFIGAEALSHEGELLASRDSQIANMISARIIQLQITDLTGDEKKKSRIKGEIQSIINKYSEGDIQLQSMMDMYLSLESINRGEPKGVVPWLGSEAEFKQKVYFSSYPLSQILYGKYMLLEKEYTRIIGYFHMMMKEEFYSRHMLFMVYSLIFMAISEYQTGKKYMAEQFLSKALDIAVRDEVYLPFMEHLDQLRPIGNVSEGMLHVESLVENIKIDEEITAESKICLTKREKELARLAAVGKTNREIGEDLFIAQSTVKRSMVVIFKKLSISNRQDLVKYQDLFD